MEKDIVECLREMWAYKIHEVSDYAARVGVGKGEGYAKILGMHCGNLAGFLESKIKEIEGHQYENKIKMLIVKANMISLAADKNILQCAHHIIDDFCNIYQKIIEIDK